MGIGQGQAYRDQNFGQVQREIEGYVSLAQVLTLAKGGTHESPNGTGWIGLKKGQGTIKSPKCTGLDGVGTSHRPGLLTQVLVRLGLALGKGEASLALVIYNLFFIFFSIFLGFFCWLSATLGGAATFRPLLGLPQACHLDVRGCYFLKSRGPTDPGAVFTSIYELPNLHIIFCFGFQIQFVTFMQILSLRFESMWLYHRPFFR